MRRILLQDNSGVIMIGALIITVFFIAISISAAEFSSNHYVSTRRTLVASSALNAAEAGADAFMTQINADSQYQGTNSAPSGATDSCTGYTPTPATLINNSVQGKVTYETCVKASTLSTEKVVYATGKVYLPATAATPMLTRKVKLIINQTTGPSYNVMSGPGGLNLGPNVHILTGPIYVGGKLTLANNATIGTILTPVTSYIGDTACPSPATSSYPQACPSSSVGITTSNNAHVYGTTHVATTVDTPSRFTQPGATQNDSIPPISLPPADHSILTSGMSNSGSMSGKACSGGVMHLSGHYTGSSTTNLNVANNCSVILDGDTWLDGNLIFGNNSSLSVLGSLSSAPNLIIDGSTGFDSGNNGSILTNILSVGINMYTFWSADTSCRPNCANVTGTNLSSSQALTTINLDNNFIGAANTSFYSRWTGISVNNNATVGQLIGQRIDLNNNGSIVFSLLSGGIGTSTWNVRYYEQIYQ